MVRGRLDSLRQRRQLMHFSRDGDEKVPIAEGTGTTAGVPCDLKAAAVGGVMASVHGFG